MKSLMKLSSDCKIFAIGNRRVESISHRVTTYRLDSSIGDGRTIREQERGHSQRRSEKNFQSSPRDVSKFIVFIDFFSSSSDDETQTQR